MSRPNEFFLAAIQEKYTNAFLGAGPETDHFALELTYNYGVDSYDLGTGFGHFALAHNDVYGLVDSIKKSGTFLYSQVCPSVSIFGHQKDSSQLPCYSFIGTL